MTLANIDYLYLVFIIPLCYYLLALSYQKTLKRKLAFAEPLLQSHLLQGSVINGNKKYLIFTAILSLLFISLLRPQWGYELKKVNRVGLEIVVALDVSESMLARDVSPTRLERAKREIIDLIDNLKGDKIALVSFAGASYVECPLTLDYSSFRLFLDAVSTDSVPLKGTNIENALSKSLNLFSKNNEINKNNKAIILITDGEEFSTGLNKVAESAKELGVSIFILGVGSKEGSPIYMEQGYKKDKDGKIIITQLNEDVLKKLALETSGIYVQSISSDLDTVAIYNQGIKRLLLDANFAQEEEKIWNEYYQYPLIIALFLLIFFYWGSYKIIPILCFTFLLNTAHGQSVESLGSEGKKAFAASDYNKASEFFSQAKNISPEDPRILMSEGATLYRLGKFEEAQVSFFEAANKFKKDLDKAQALFNAGNSLVQQEKYQEAIKAYQDSMQLNSEDKETTENLEYAKRKLEEQKKKENQQSKEDQEKQNKSSETNKQETKDNQDQQQENQSKKDDKGSENDQKNENDKPQENPDQSKDKQDSADQPDLNSEQKEEDKNQSEKKESPEGSSEEQREQNLNEQILKSIEEKSENRLKYRLQQAIQDLKRKKQQLPEKDW